MKFLLPLFILPCYAWRNVYQKPNPSNGPCIETIENMQDALNYHGSSQFCLGCDTSQRTCPKEPNCQYFIDNIYSFCKGVTLPISYYYDVPVSLAYHCISNNV